MKQIPLTKGYFAQVDDEDFTKVNQFKWYASRGKKDPTFYAERGKRVNGKISIILLHRFVMGLTDPKIQVDHEDHDGLNCQQRRFAIFKRIFGADFSIFLQMRPIAMMNSPSSCLVNSL